MNSELEALGLTLLIEVPLYVVALTRATADGWRRATATALMVNLVSHPIAFLVLFPSLKALTDPTFALVATEAAVMIGEAAMLVWRGTRLATACIVSASVNLASFVLGVALFR